MSQDQNLIVGAASGGQARMSNHPREIVRRQIIVLGMHRSGTSAVMRVLEFMGAYVGEADQLTKPSSQNAHGFFERRDARRICDALLHGSDSDWWRISKFDLDTVPHSVIKDQRADIQQMIEDLNTHDIWALKEPRLCLLLPIIIRFLRDPVVVHVFRNPIEVARSLRFRNGFPTRAGLAMWEAYNIACLKHTKNVPRVSLNYDLLMQAPSKTIVDMSHKLARLGVVGLDAVRGPDAVDRTLKREHVQDSDVQYYLTPAQLALWKALSAEELWEFGAEISPDAMAALREFEADEAARRASERTIVTLSSELAKRDMQCKSLAAKLKRGAASSKAATVKLKERGAEIVDLAAQLQQREAENSNLAARLAEREAEVSSLAARLQQSESDVNAAAVRLMERTNLATRLAEREAEFSDLATRLRQSKSDAHATAERLTERNAEVDSLRAKLKQRDADIQASAADVGALKRRIGFLKNTVSWRITAPLRAIYRGTYRLSDWQRTARVGATTAGLHAEPRPSVTSRPRISAAGNASLASAQSQDPRPQGESARTALKRAVAKAEAASKTQNWREAMTRWQAVLDKFGDEPKVAAQARLNISVARRLSNTAAYKREIHTYFQRRRIGAASPHTPKIALYTAICGNYDSVKLPETIDARIDYFIFTERADQEQTLYTVRPIPHYSEDSTRTARYAKTHPHFLLSEYDIVVWIDANIMILGDIFPLIEEFLASGKPVGAIPHPVRKSVYEEVDACIERNKDSADLITAQITRYRARGFDCSDLIETNFMMFDLRDERVRKFLDTWWAEVDNFSKRDQLSVNFALRQAGVEWHRITEFPNSLRNHPKFAFAAHDFGAGPARLLLDAFDLTLSAPDRSWSDPAGEKRTATEKLHRETPQVKIVRQKLLELGLTDRALADLHGLAADKSDPATRKLAAWELAVWHANQYSAEHAVQCLAQLAIAIQDEEDKAQHCRAIVLASECHSLLGNVESGRTALEKALGLALSPDLYLAAANLEASAETRLHYINKALALTGVSSIACDPDRAGSYYDRLRPADDGSSGSERDASASDRPWVSVIVPAYNAESTLQTALDSILAQTWANLEVIVVDDCSTDGTPAIVTRYAERDPRIHLVEATANRGPYVSRNIGLERATGEFVTCNDADDWSHPSKIEIQVRNLRNNSDTVANMSSWVRMTDDLKAHRRGNAGFFAQANVSSLLFRREPVRDALWCWDSVRFGADTEFWNRIRKVFGESSVEEMTPILSFGRCSGNSLTEHTTFGYPGFAMGARREYRESYFHYFSSANNFRYAFPQESRAFPVPRIMRTTDSSENPVRFDAVLVSDFRLRENASWAATLITTERRKGSDARIGLVQLYRYEIDPRRRIDSKLRDLVDGDQVTIVTFGEAVACDLLIVKDISALQDRQRYVPDVNADTTVLVMDSLPTKTSALGSYSYDLGACVENLEHYFGDKGIWFPVSPRVKNVVERHYQEALQGVTMARGIWPTSVDLTELAAKVRLERRDDVLATKEVHKARSERRQRASGCGVAEVIDVRDLHNYTHNDAEGVVAIMPCIDTDKGARTSEILLRRAGIICTVIVIHDTLRQGFIRTLNEAAARVSARYIVYLAEDAYPGRDWLRNAYNALEKSGCGLLGFNDGKWSGRIASFGMVRTEWVRALYGGPVLYPGYHSHKADNELTVIARALETYLYDPNCILIEYDPDKDSGGSNPKDDDVFSARFRSGFGGLAPLEKVLNLAKEYKVK
jgi:glycosyltransferase involved in cell wall biosynthesis